MGTSVSCRVMACWLLGVFSYLWLPFFFVSSDSDEEKICLISECRAIFFPPSPPVLLSISHQGFGFFLCPETFSASFAHGQ